ncbi:glycerol uptake facilitator protein/aquaporin Z/aquaporin NIP [Geodermatophilus bullaregiensis]|uniref:MIP/aquaporin family protein n=1 Tax=Geodermatophilus bullaregiensis TaxID=1564160 RepID=UPI00195C20DF|nr:aquaporin [Geodermatophilus bullaregiensis]MBM7806933.1 glycerol uptake facilitator protein/aquaporin Z/aquaporin NIP [Geodermatophilus bullaregiensis]
MASSRTARETATTGLYGSRIGTTVGRTALTEFIGTAILVFVGTGTAVASAATGQATYDSLAVVLAFGFTLTALAAAFGHVSGCHLNPAVTLGLAVTRRFPWPAAGAYVVAQLAGGVAGVAATWAVFGAAARDQGQLGATVPLGGISAGQAFLAEALVTFVLVLVVVSVATDDRAQAAIAPVAVGFALAAGIFVAGPLTGGAVNPARAFGPDLLAGQLSSLWIYLLAPTVGGVLAAVVYDRLLAAGEPPEA